MDSIQSLIKEQVIKAGSAIAIDHGQIQMTYAELNQSANQVANHLAKLGVRKGSMVAIVLERGHELVTYLVGCVKLGVIFVPLDPNFPDGRLELMLAGAKPEWLVVVPENLPRMESLLAKVGLTQTRVVLSNAQFSSAESTAVGGELEEVTIAPEDPCYIFFTSGSTGRPKGILGSYKGLLHFIQWEIGTFGVGAGDRVSQFTTPSFDAVLRDIFVPLAAGATICIPAEQELILDSERLVRWVEEKRLTLIHCVPSLFRRMLSHVGDAKQFADLRYILMAGERIQLPDAKKWYSYFGERIKLVNMYGASETTMIKVFHIITREDLESGLIPAGKPMQGAKVVILDQDKNICPPGVVGEIYVRTPYMTLGYYGDPERTKEVFLQNPFSNKPGDLIYKTGDLGRILPDGNLEFIGRSDQQVKIRGVRVELGEIESQLAEYPDVKEVAVTVRQDLEGENYPVAYLVLHEGKDTLTSDILRQYLSERLPEYMIPKVFVTLKKMPLTPTGKIDRQALPEPEEELATGVEYLAPRNALEEELVRIFQEVLGRERIGVEDNFFTLGGHSLNATRVITRIYQQMEIQIPLRYFFKMPTIAGLAQIIAQQQKVGYQKIAVSPRAEYYPLSHSQRRLWLLCQMNKGLSSAYNLSSAFILEGEVDRAAFELAFQQIVERHEVLRTYFTQHDGEPRQVVDDGYEFRIEYFEQLPSVNDAVEGRRNSSETNLANFVNHEAARPFDLSKPGLLRASLVCLEPNRYLANFTIHHIISDAWSLSLLVKEFFHQYTALVNGRGAKLPPLRIQYRDYAAWQQELLTNGTLQKQGDYWHSVFTGEIPVLNMPTDYRRPAVQSFKGERVHFQFESATQSQKLSELAREQGTTLFTLLFTAYNILLHRYTGQEAIVVGIPVHGRNDPDLEDLIGFFINTLAVQSSVQNNAKFSTVLETVQQRLIEAFENQDYPFDQLVEELELKRDLSRSPLFDTMFVLQNTPELTGADTSMDSVTLKPFEQERNSSRFDIIMTLMETSAGLAGTIEYSTDIFKRETMQRFARHYDNLLNSILANPESAITSLSIMSDTERKMLLCDFNQTQSEFPKTQTLAQLFEEIVITARGRTALVYGDVRYTYEELNCRANQLAHLLRKRGVGANEIVGMLVEPSVEMIVGILAVLKAGGAYLPIDPEYPEERIQYLLSDSGAKLLLTNEDLRERLAFAKLDFTGAVLVLDDERNYQSADANLPIINKADDLAYVMYTSGTTGRPKGNLTTHYNITRVVQNTNYIEITPYDRILQLSNYAFDGSTFQIFGALLNGAELHVISKETILNAYKLSKYLTDRQISLLFITTAYFNTMVDTALESLAGVRKILFGGERASVAHVRKAVKYLGSDRLLHVYGPTESTVFATYHPVTHISTVGDNVPIGKPISNTQIYIVDSAKNLQPIGVVGELCIAGDGLVKGYLNQHELTAEKFVENPYRKGIMYRTGDLARWLPSGDIEFIGRIDNQIKLRGFRIELAEIEARLLTHPAIKEAYVMDREYEDGNKFLCAYLVINEGQSEKNGNAALTENHIKENANSGDTHVPAVEALEICTNPVSSPTVSELRAHLAKALPDYMIPAYFMYLDNLPLNMNGKVDRKALPAPELQELERDFVPPKGDLEIALANIWCEVLGVKAISRDEHFFALGGHSLKATQVIARISKELGLECPLELFFRAPTIAELAQGLAAEKHAKYAEITAGAKRDTYPVSHAQKRLWVIEQMAEIHGAYNLQLTELFDGELNKVALEQDLRTIIERHEVLRTRFGTQEGEVVQIVEDTPNLDISYADWRGKDTNTLKQYIFEEGIKPFDLTKPGQLRFVIARLTENLQLLLCTMHHIISDGWSLNIFRKEIFELYQAYKDGKTNPLQPLRIQYRDFSDWQNAGIQAGTLKGQEEYWLKELAGELPVLELPIDYPRQPVQTFRGAELFITLDTELSARLKHLAQKEGVTPFMLGLASYNVLLYQYTGQQDILVGTPIAGRPHRDLEDLIGFFVNTLVMRTQLTPTDNFLALLHRVREKSLQNFKGQDYPFDALVDLVVRERDMSRSPIFDTMFVFQNATAEAVAEPRVALDEVAALNAEQVSEVQDSVSKFDLTVSMSENGGQLCCKFNFNTDLFKVRTIERMARHFKYLLTQIAEHPEVQVYSYQLTTAEEKAQLLHQFNPPLTPYPQHTVQELFEEKAAKYPERVAVIAANETLTYDALNQRANLLARHLVAKGVGPEQVVAILMKRRSDVIVSILAILKVGGAYLPIDLEYPKERIADLLADSGVELVLTQSTVKDHIPQSYTGEVVLVDDSGTYANYSSANLNRPVGPEDLAYIIYTSGSTGKPKGVMIEHQNLTHEYYVEAKLYPVRKDYPVMLQVVSHSFDPFVLDQCQSIFSGGTLVMTTEEERYSLEALVKLIQKHQVDRVLLPTGMLKLFMDYISEQQISLPSLDYLFTGGDSLKVEIYERMLKTANDQFQIINVYGTTETTIQNTNFQGAIAEHVRSGIVPIGTTNPNSRIYVLNQQMQLVPQGVIGEIYIGGYGVGRGYYNRPEITESRFIADPFVTDAKAKMYKTGDLGRWLSDGNLEFFGRIDHQVKIRGYRIEIGEIEAVLLNHPAVKNAAVVDFTEASGEKYLVGYVVSSAKEEIPTAAELQRYLGARLPEYMVPQVILTLEELPLTSNGKLDRKRLPISQVEKGSYTAPRSEIEEIIAKLWSEVLGCEDLGVEENFLNLGGNSLKMIQLMMKFNTQFKTQFTLKHFMEHMTIAEQAQSIECTVKDGVEVGSEILVNLRGGTGTRNLFCIHPGGGGVVVYQPLAQLLDPAFNIYGIQARGLFSPEPLPNTLEEMARDYIKTIKTLQPLGPYYLLGHSIGGSIAYEMTRQLEVAGETVAELILLDSVSFGELEKIASKEEQKRGMILIDLHQLGIKPVRRAEKHTVSELLQTYFTPENLLNTPYSGMSLTEIKHLYKVRSNIIEIVAAPKGKISSTITLYTAKESKHRKREKGWQKWTKGEVRVQEVTGNHYTMLESPHVQKLAREINVTLTKNETTSGKYPD